MIAVLALLFLVVPIAELAVIVKVAGAIGVPETLLLLIAISFAGGWLMKREGLGLLRRVQTMIQHGELPHREVVDGMLILLAGALMLTPGFLSDILGLVLLFPPTRAAVRAVVYRRFRRNIVVSFGTADGRAYDVKSRENTPPSRREIEP